MSSIYTAAGSTAGIRFLESSVGLQILCRIIKSAASVVT